MQGLPDGDYTIRETDLAGGKKLCEQEFSLTPDMESPWDMVFGSEEDVQLLRGAGAARWLRDSCIFR